MSVPELPVVGVCAAFERTRWAFWDQPAAVVAASYLDHVRAGGGVPVVLAPARADPATIATLAGRVDGLLLLGGCDIDPARYGDARSQETEAVSPVRDDFELGLLAEARRRDLPVLGICRGMQMMAVAAGGSLDQHLPDGGPVAHRPHPGVLDERTYHRVDVAAASTLAGLIGDGAHDVNSHHHQAVTRPGAGAVIGARSVDGIIEAIEWPDRRFAIGVQWHPEAMPGAGLVGGLVAACRKGAPA